MVTISIVTPTFERGSFIETAMDSVTAQSYPPCEHIVIDGGSHDDTLSRLQRYPDVQIVSEPDRGLYDAINKGIRRARGDVICLLNSDDRLLPGALEAVRAAFARDPSIQAVCGRVRIGEVRTEAHDIELGDVAMQRLRLGDIISGLPLTNSRFLRRTVFERIGDFDQDYPVLADRDFFGRLFLSGIQTATIDRALYRYGTHASSLSFGTGAGQADYNNEAIRLASARLAQSSTDNERAFYRRWLGWAIGYMLVRASKNGNLLKAYRMSADARGLLSRWPLEFVVQLIWHLATRVKRRGAPVYF